MSTMTNVALLVGFSIAALATPALAAVGDPEAASGRDAAVAACTAQAKQRFGGIYYNFDQSRAFTYGACMQERGQPR
jgi:hypothetical protein